MKSPIKNPGHDWMSLVDMSGVMVSEPVLHTFFPEGPKPANEYVVRQLERAWRGYQIRADEGAADAKSRWMSFVYDIVLEIPRESWKVSNDIPDSCIADLQTYDQRLVPNRVMMKDNVALLSVLEYFNGQELNKVETKTGKWKASPLTKIDRLLRETKVQFGLLTNGREFMLVHCPPGLTTSTITWTAQTWVDDTSTLAGFIMLAGKERFLGKDNLSMLVQESQKRQVDVTDQLGEQVKDALDAFVRAANRYNKAMKGKPLEGMSEFEIYEMSLSVMMRLVFLLYAEENRLLPHGHFFYDQAYGVTHLWTELDRNKEQLAENKDAWQRMLSTFRLIYYGCKHPDFNMRAYGGHMFEPTRFPALEQLQLDNKTIHEIVRKLLFSKAKVGKEIVNQRVSYRTLDIEQLGSVYEGLMEYKVKRASEVLVTFKGKTQEIRPLSEVAEVEEYKEKEMTDYLKNITGFTDNKIKKQLVADGEIEDDEILDASILEDVDIIDTPDTETAPPEISEETPQFQVQSKTEKILPFINLDKTIGEGDLYLTREGSARKGSGSYYTPKQLTSFLVKEALEPLTHNEDKTIKKPKEILELKVCDPAMGSGAFLVQAIRYLSERLVESWDHEATQTEKRITIPYGTPANGDFNQQGLPEDREEAMTWAKRFVVQNCIYGVDLNPLAVELAKMSLWLATLSKDKPFTFLDHRLRCGNSLIGAEFDKLASVPSEPLWKADKKVNDRALERVAPFTEFQINNLVKSIITNRGDLSKNEQSILDVQEKEQLIGKMEEEGSNYDKIKDLCDLWCSVWFWPYEEQAKKSTATLEEFLGEGATATESTETIPPPHTTRYHQVIRYMATGHADMDEEVCKKIIDTSHEVAKEQRFFHWELEFPEIFRKPDGGAKENPGFDAMVGNPPWEIMKQNSQEFFSAYDPDFRSYVKQKAKVVIKKLMEDRVILQGWNKHSRIVELQSVFYRKSGMYPHLGGGDINLYKLFLERFHQKINSGGYESIIVPSGMYMDKGAAPLRKFLLNKSQIKYLICFENREKVFPIDSRFKFVLFTSQKGDSTDKFKAGFMLHDLGVLNNLENNLIRMDKKLIEKFSPDTFSIMEFKNQEDIDISTQIYNEFPLIGMQIPPWKLKFFEEFHLTMDEKRFNNNNKGLQIYEGKNIWHFTNNLSPTTLNMEYENAFDKYKDNKDWIKSHDKFKIGYRKVASNTNERTLISTILPKKILTVYSIYSQYHYLNGNQIIDNGKNLFSISIMNSYVIDYVIRNKVSSNVTISHVYQLPFPCLLPTNWFYQQFVPRTARLVCTNNEFIDLWKETHQSDWQRIGNTSELSDWKDLNPQWTQQCGAYGWTEDKRDTGDRAQLRAEIDALVAHLYGLTEEEFAYILDTFPVLKKNEERAFGEFRSKRMCLEEYRRLAPIIEAEKKKNPKAFEIPKWERVEGEESFIVDDGDIEGGEAD